jgi:hypothetical protein
MAEKAPATAHAPAPQSDIEKLADAILARGPKGPIELSGLDEDAQRRLTTPPTPKRWRMVKGKSEKGCTFTMHVVESKKLPHGRVTRLEDYKHPTAIYVVQAAGGQAPDGMPIYKGGQEPARLDPGEEPPKGALNPYFLQWRWETYYQEDLRLLVGKELRIAYCLDEAQFKAPWQDGRLGPLDAEQGD